MAQTIKSLKQKFTVQTQLQSKLEYEYVQLLKLLKVVRNQFEILQKSNFELVEQRKLKVQNDMWRALDEEVLVK